MTDEMRACPRKAAGDFGRQFQRLAFDHSGPSRAARAKAELAQMLQTMTRDLANVQQGIEQLKTSQEQMASDNGKVLEQLKTRQEQVARDNAKTAEEIKAGREQMARFLAVRASEQNLQPKTPRPHPIAAPKR
jgi:predicted  nucleic acid-binding Zn-ribbon protein